MGDSGTHLDRKALTYLQRSERRKKAHFKWTPFPKHLEGEFTESRFLFSEGSKLAMGGHTWLSGQLSGKICYAFPISPGLEEDIIVTSKGPSTSSIWSESCKYKADPLF